MRAVLQPKKEVYAKQAFKEGEFVMVPASLSINVETEETSKKKKQSIAVKFSEEEAPIVMLHPAAIDDKCSALSWLLIASEEN